MLLKLIITLSITFSFSFSSNFETIKEKVIPLERGLIESDFAGHWLLSSLDSSDSNNYLYNISNKEPITLDFASMNHSLLIDNTKPLNSFFVYKDKLFIGESRLNQNLDNTEEFKVLGYFFFEENKKCYLLELKKSIFSNARSNLICKN